MMLKTMAKIGVYNNERIGIVIKPDPNPKKPLTNPENNMISMIIIKLSGKKLSKIVIFLFHYINFYNNKLQKLCLNSDYL